MRKILPHSAKQVSSHPVQVRCTALTLLYLLIRTSRPSPGLQSNVSEESSPLPGHTLAFTAGFFKLYLLIHTSRPSPGLQSDVSEESSPLPDTHASFYRSFYFNFIFLSALPDRHRGFRVICPRRVALSRTHTLAFTAVLFLLINPHFQTVTGASE